MRINVKRGVVYCVVVSAVYLLSHASFYGQPLMREEGMYAKVFCFNVQGPAYIIAARVNGVEYYDPPRHPAGMFEMMRLAGKVASLFGDMGAWEEPRRTRVVRIVFSLWQLVAWVAFAAVVGGQASIRLHPAEKALMILIVLSPLVFTSALSLPPDGSLGVLMCGLVATAFLSYSQHESPSDCRLRGILIIGLAAAFLGFGKQPWTICLIGAVLLSFAYGVLTQRIRHVNSVRYSYLASALLGCLAGNVFSYLLDPLNYSAGWQFAFAAAKSSSLIALDQIHRWKQLTVLRMPFICTNLVLFGLVFCLVVRRSRWVLDTATLFNFCFSLLLFSSCFVASWNEEPRYFAPSIVPLTACFVSLSARGISCRPVVLWTTCIILALHAGSFLAVAAIQHRSVAQYPGEKYCESRDCLKQLVPLDRSCVPVLDTAYGYSKSDVDFVGASLAPEQARHLVESHGGKLCPETR